MRPRPNSTRATPRSVRVVQMNRKAAESSSGGLGSASPAPRVTTTAYRPRSGSRRAATAARASAGSSPRPVSNASSSTQVRSRLRRRCSHRVSWYASVVTTDCSSIICQNSLAVYGRTASRVGSVSATISMTASHIQRPATRYDRSGASTGRAISAHRRPMSAAKDRSGRSPGAPRRLSIQVSSPRRTSRRCSSIGSRRASGTPARTSATTLSVTPGTSAASRSAVARIT